MSLKQEIETWVAALGSYDNNEFDEALKLFDGISDTSKILFNCGVIHATLGEHQQAVECYQRAVRLDQYLAVAYFQQGVSNFLMGDFGEALANFNDTLLYLRGNNNIDYEQLGLKFKLYSCEVLFNRGLCYIYLQQRDAGMQDLSYAAKEKVVPDHDVIDEAIGEEAEGYTVFSIPVGIVYRPNEAKVKNLKTKDYLGKARLIAASDRYNAFTGFAGSEMKITNTAKDDRPQNKLSFAATNLVKPEIQSRMRQQSEPPMNRNVFPPTPPPESDTRRGSAGERGGRSSAGERGGMMSRAQSVRGGGPKPQPLVLGRAAFDRREEPPMPQRRGTTRSASERPALSRGESTRMRDMDRRKREWPRHFGSHEEGMDGFVDADYDDYQQPRPSRSSNMRSRQPSIRPTYIDEEDEEDYDGSDLDDADFEMVSRAKSQKRRSPLGRSNTNAGLNRSTTNAGLNRSNTSAGGRGGKIKVKVHAGDTRCVFVTPGSSMRDFVQSIREKFGLRQPFKIEIQDDGDMITMADEDDLDMAIRSARALARKEGADAPKMEVWIKEA